MNVANRFRMLEIVGEQRPYALPGKTPFRVNGVIPLSVNFTSIPVWSETSSKIFCNAKDKSWKLFLEKAG